MTWNEYEPYTRADVKRILGRLTQHIRFVDLRTGRLIATVLTLWDELDDAHEEVNHMYETRDD